MESQRSGKRERRKRTSHRRQLDISQGSDDQGLPSLNPPRRTSTSRSSSSDTSSDPLDAPQSISRDQDRNISEEASGLSEIRNPIPPFEESVIPVSIRRSEHRRPGRKKREADKKIEQQDQANRPTQKTATHADASPEKSKRNMKLPLPPWLFKLQGDDPAKDADNIIVDEKLDPTLSSTKTLTGTNFGKCDITIELETGIKAEQPAKEEAGIELEKLSKEGVQSASRPAIRSAARPSRRSKGDTKQKFGAGDRRPGAYEIHRRAPGYLPAWLRRSPVGPNTTLSAEVEVRQVVDGEGEIEEIELPFRWGLCIGLCVFCLLMMIGAVLAIVFAVRSSGGGEGGDGNVPTPSPKSPVLTCDFTGIAQPDPFQQCACNGSITVISEGVRNRYEELRQRFISSVFSKFDARIESCLSENLGLVWLAVDTEKREADWTALRNRYILAMLYALWNGVAWNDSTSWLSSESECYWSGVSCIRSVVTELILPENNVHGSIPKHVGLLTGMRVLDLSDNFLQGTLPNELYLATNLEQLIVWRNSLEGSLNSRIGNLKNLQVLGIEQNHFTGTLPDSMTSLTHMKWFLLKGNSFEGPLFDKVLKWPEIEAVEVRSNSFEGKFPRTLGFLKKLRILDISFNSIQGSIPTTLGVARSLEYIVIDGHHLQGTIPTEIGNLDKLSHFSVLTGKLNGTIPTEIGKLALLENLILTSNDLSGSIPSEIGSCAALRSFDVGRNKLTGTVPSEIGKLSHLRTLKIDGTNIGGNLSDEICELRDEALTTFLIPCQTEMGCFADGCCIPQCT